MDFFLSGGVNRDIVALKGGDIVGVPRLQVADFECEIRMAITRTLSAAGTFFRPGFLWGRSAGRTRGVGTKAFDGVLGGGLEQSFWSDRWSLGAALALFRFLDQDTGSGVRQTAALQHMHVFSAVGVQFPEIFRKVSVLRTRQLISARAVLQFRFEGPSGVFTDFVGILSVNGLEVASYGVGVDALL